MANALGDFMAGYQAGDDMLERQRGQRQRNQLARLADDVISGDPLAYSQAAAINPKVAASYRKAGDDIALKARGAAKYLQQALQSGNAQQIAAARQAIKPFMDTMKPGTSYPLDMDPTQELAGIQGFLTQTESLDPMYSKGNAGGVQSTYINRQGQRVAVMRDGTQQLLGEADARLQVRDQPGIDPGIIDLRSGTVRPLGVETASVVPAETDIQADAQLANEMIAAGIPAAQVDAFLTARGQRADSVAVAGGGTGAAAARPAVSLADSARLSMEAERLRLAREAAADRNVPSGYERAPGGGLQAIPGGPADAKRSRPLTASERRDAQTRKTKYAQARNLQRGLQRIQTALKSLNGGIVDTGPIDQYAQRYSKEGQELEAAVGAIQNSLTALTRTPGIGSQSDLETRLGMLQYPALNRDPAVNTNTMRDLQAFTADLLSAYDTAVAGDQQDAAAGEQPAAPSAADGVDDLLSKYGIR